MAKFSVELDVSSMDSLIREEIRNTLDPDFIKSRVERILDERINNAITSEIASRMRTADQWNILISKWVESGALKSVFSSEATNIIQKQVTKWVDARENILRDMALNTIRTHVQNALSLGKWFNMNLRDSDTSKNPAEESSPTAQ